MAFGNAELDKLKGVERAEHALNHSDLDRPKHYYYDHEMSKEAFEKQKAETTNAVSRREVVTKAGEVIVVVIGAAVLFTFLKGLFM